MLVKIVGFVLMGLLILRPGNGTVVSSIFVFFLSGELTSASFSDFKSALSNARVNFASSKIAFT